MFRHKLYYSIIGFLIGNSILALSVFGIYLFTSQSDQVAKITLEQAVSRIENRQVDEVIFKSDRAIFRIQEEVVEVMISSDAVRGYLLERVNSANIVGQRIAVIMEAPDPPLFPWIFLLNLFPMVIIGGLVTIIVLLISILLKLKRPGSLT